MLLFPGCAFGLTGPDPNRPQGKVPECDTGKGLVVLDGMVATAAGIVAIGLASADEGEAALIPLSLGALYIGGAILGNNRVNECRKAMGEFESYMAAREIDDTERRPVRRVQPPESPPSVAVVPPPVAPPPAPVAAPVPPAATVPTPKPAVAPAKPAPPPAPAKRDDEWSDFWQEGE